MACYHQNLSEDQTSLCGQQWKPGGQSAGDGASEAERCPPAHACNSSDHFPSRRRHASPHSSLGCSAHSGSPFTLGAVPLCCVHACVHVRPVPARRGRCCSPASVQQAGVKVPMLLCCHTAPSPVSPCRRPVRCLLSLLVEAVLFRYENVAPGWGFATGKGHAY